MLLTPSPTGVQGTTLESRLEAGHLLPQSGPPRQRAPIIGRLRQNKNSYSGRKPGSLTGNWEWVTWDRKGALYFTYRLGLDSLDGGKTLAENECRVSGNKA